MELNVVFREEFGICGIDPSVVMSSFRNSKVDMLGENEGTVDVSLNDGRTVRIHGFLDDDAFLVDEYVILRNSR